MTLNPWKLIKAVFRIASSVLRLEGRDDIADVVNTAEVAAEGALEDDEPDGGT